MNVEFYTADGFEEWARQALACVAVAQRTVSEWSKNPDGTVTAHTDVITKALAAAADNLRAALRKGATK